MMTGEEGQTHSQGQTYGDQIHNRPTHSSQIYGDYIYGSRIHETTSARPTVSYEIYGDLGDLWCATKPTMSYEADRRIREPQCAKRVTVSHEIHWEPQDLLLSDSWQRVLRGNGDQTQGPTMHRSTRP